MCNNSSARVKAGLVSPAVIAQCPAKIVQTVKNALEYTENRAEWRLEVSCVCVAA